MRLIDSSFSFILRNITPLVFLSFISSYAWAHGDEGHSKARFDNESYKKKCSKKATDFIQNCNDETLNQMTIFNEAKDFAASHSKLLLLEFSSNECSSCKLFHDDWDIAEEARKKVEQDYILVKINFDMSSAKNVMNRLGLNVFATPSFVVVNSDSIVIKNVFYRSQFKTIEALAKQLTPLAKDSINKIGKASIGLLNSDIELYNSGFGTVNFVTEQENNLTSKASQFVNQGMAHLYVFDYADAFRSFQMAAKESPNSMFPKIGKIFSYFEMDNRLGAYAARELAVELIQFIKNPPLKASQKERLWSQFAISYFVKKTHSLFMERISDQPQKDISESLKELLEEFPESPDVLAFGHYMAGLYKKEAPFLQALELDPNHTGAHHYLTHFYEGAFDRNTPTNFQRALVHAKRLSELAPLAPHALHMYAHILPHVGEWEKAAKYFEMADEIHIKWGKKNKVSPNEHWHNIHNKNLLTSIYSLIGKNQMAYDTVTNACLEEFDPEICLAAIDALLAMGDERNARVLIVKLTETRPNLSGALYLAHLRSAVYHISPEGISKDEFPTPEPLAPNKMLSNREQSTQFTLELVHLSLDAPKEEMANLELRLTSYFEKRIKGAGFDAWASGAYDIICLYLTAWQLGHQTISQALYDKIIELLPLVKIPYPQPTNKD